jgi:hypothetical protein
MLHRRTHVEHVRKEKDAYLVNLKVTRKEARKLEHCYCNEY